MEKAIRMNRITICQRIERIVNQGSAIQEKPDAAAVEDAALADLAA